MDLWPRHAAAGANRRHHLTTAHLVAAFDQKGLGVAIGRHPPVGVFDQKKVAKTAEPGAGVGDNTVFRRFDRRAARRRDIDPVIVQTAFAGTETTDNAPGHRRQKGAGGTLWRAEQATPRRRLGGGRGCRPATVSGALAGGGVAAGDALDDGRGRGTGTARGAAATTGAAAGGGWRHRSPMADAGIDRPASDMAGPNR